MRHYKILYEESKELSDGTFVYRIEATQDNIHVSEGTKGGFIADSGNLVGENSWVDGEAIVSSRAIVSGNGFVGDTAEVSGNATVDDHGKVTGDARITGKAHVSDHTEVTGNCIMKENSQIRGNTILKSDVVLGGKALIQEGTWTRTPFHAPFGKNNYYISECRQGFVRVGCVENSIKGWLYNGWKDVLNKNGPNWTVKFLDLYYKLVPMNILEPLMKELFEESQKPGFEIPNIPFMFEAKKKHSAWLKSQGMEDYTEKYTYE